MAEAEKLTGHVSRVVFPAFSLDRGDGCEIHENAYWGLQTYLELRENLAANKGARSFVYESNQNRTPLGRAHREHLRDLSVAEIREMYLKEEHGIYGPVKDGPSNTRAETTLVGLPPDEDRDERQVFLTNLAVTDEIRLDRRRTRRKIKRYTRRGGIENAYGSIKQFSPWTTSKEYAVRLFHFGFAMLLYDMWLLVDLLVQHSLGVVEFRTKPRGDDPRFRGFLRRRLITLL